VQTATYSSICFAHSTAYWRLPFNASFLSLSSSAVNKRSNRCPLSLSCARIAKAAGPKRRDASSDVALVWKTGRPGWIAFGVDLLLSSTTRHNGSVDATSFPAECSNARFQTHYELYKGFQHESTQSKTNDLYLSSPVRNGW